MKKLKTGFTQYGADDLIGFGTTAGPAIAVIAFLAGITPTPATIASQTTDLINKKAATGPGSKQAMHASMAVLRGSLSLVATNINEMPGITEPIMAQTTLPMTKERTVTTTEPDKPIDFRLKNGQVSGAVRGRCKLTSPNILMLEVQWTLDPINGPWTAGEPTRDSQNIELDGLPRGKDVWVQVAARNVIGLGAWSDPATIMVI